MDRTMDGGLKVCKSCLVLVTDLSPSCDCDGPAQPRPLTIEEWSMVQDEPPTQTK